MIEQVDFWAIKLTSPVHRLAAGPKLVVAGLILAGVVTSRDLVFLLGTFLLLSGVILLAGLPWVRVLLAGFYPVVLLVPLLIAQGLASPLGALLMVGKAVDAALTMLVVITTTPYPVLFAALRRVAPGLLVDTLFLAYRSFFILLGLAGDVLLGLRLRGGLSARHWGRRLASIGQGIGLIIIRGIDLGEDFNRVLRLRGYRGQLTAGGMEWRFCPPELVGLLVGVTALAFGAEHAVGGVLAAYNGYWLVFGFGVLLGSAGFRVSGRGGSVRWS
jgi:cobalt/nickel transport system permease protein